MTVVLLLIVVPVVLYLVLSFTLARSYVHPARTVSERPARLAEERIAGAPCWTSPGWREKETVFLLAHGYGGSRSQWTVLGPRLARMGYGVVAPAMPGHDLSPEPSVGFGRTESELVLRLAREIAPRRVVAVGVSMGGAAVWQAAGREPAVFHAVATEGAYPSFDEAMDRFLVRFRLPRAFYGGMISMARLMTGVDPSAQRPVEGAIAWGKTGKPCAIAHGGADKLFPTEFGVRLGQAAGCPVWIVPGARHAYVDETDRKGWLRRLTALAEP